MINPYLIPTILTTQAMSQMIVAGYLTRISIYAVWGK